MTTRQERIKELLKAEISDIIMRQIKDPRVGFVTITDAEVTKDLRHAKIYISVMGDEKQKEDTLTALRSASGYIRSEFGRRATMKTIPDLSFKLDTAVEHGARIFELLQQVEHNDQK